jgi:hypothetical protein
MLTAAQQFLPVLGPQVDTKFWSNILYAGQGEITGPSPETVAILHMRSMPSPFVVANGRNIDPVSMNPATVIPGR